MNVKFLPYIFAINKNVGATFRPPKDGLHYNTHAQTHKNQYNDKRIHTYKYKLTPVMGSKAAICIGLNE